MTPALTDKALSLCSNLAHGDQRVLEVAIALASGPRVLMLDEPAAGMTDAETEYTAELFRTLAGQHSLMVVEHDMAFIEQLGGKVTVLHEGAVLAEGEAAQGISLRREPSADARLDLYTGREEYDVDDTLAQGVSDQWRLDAAASQTDDEPPKLRTLSRFAVDEALDELLQGV